MMQRPITALFALTLAACGAASHGSTLPTTGDAISMEEMRIVASAGSGGEVVFDSYDAGQLFEAGTRLLQRGECREAVEQFYDRIIAEFPASRYAAPALYNSGLCLHEGGELEASVPYYEGVLETAPQGRDARHAALQLSQVLIGLERWEPALALVDRVLLREDLQEPERLEGLARRAQALLGLERFDAAGRQARNALSYYRMQERRAAIAEPYFAAAANYVLAESMRMTSETMELPPGSAEEQHTVLDARARLLLNAQREYFNTIRHTDAEWAAAAGYRIGSMYDRFWHSLMGSPIPPPSRTLAEADVPVYEEEYRSELARHIRPLLRHAIRYWELTLLMVERTGVQTDWSARTQTELERMRGLLLEQTDPIAEEDTPAEPSSDVPEDTSTEDSGV